MRVSITGVLAGFAARSAKRRALLSVLLPASLSLCSAACGGSGQYVWFNELPKTEWAQTPNEYVLGIGDDIRVQVFEQEALTTRTKIRTDGRIALPFVGEIVAVGKHPFGLGQEIAARLKEFIVSPRVIVNVEASQPITVSVLGEVGKVGSLTLPPSSTVIEAIAQAGGPTDYADKSSIFLLRKAPEFRRIRFKYDALVQNEQGAATFPLQTGDVIVVE